MRLNSIAAAARIGIGVAFLLVQGHAVQSAEVKVFSVRPLKTFLEALGPRFERETGHTLVFTFDVSASLKRRIDAGEAFDAVVILPDMIEGYLKQGTIAAGTRRDISRAAIGVAVKKGAPKPDISSAGAFKRTLLDAKSIAFSSEGGSGKYFKELLERLGIAAETKPRLQPLTSSAVVPAVAKGEAELAVISPPAILADPGVELVGTLPKELQHYVVYTAGVSAAAKEAQAAKALLEYLTAPAATLVMKSKGLEPITP